MFAKIEINLTSFCLRQDDGGAQNAYSSQHGQVTAALKTHRTSMSTTAFVSPIPPSSLFRTALSLPLLSITQRPRSVITRKKHPFACRINHDNGDENGERATDNLYSESPNRTGTDASAAIHVRDVNFTWPNGRCALADVSLDVHPGQITMIVGRNGCGKSTLLKVLRNIIFPDSGSVHVSSPCAYIMQDPGSQIIFPTVGTDISMSIVDRELRSKDEVKAEILDILNYVGLVPPEEFMSRGRSDLSGGQKQRVVLAAALVRSPKTILFDEVTASLDPISRADLLERVRALITKLNIAAIWYVIFFSLLSQHVHLLHSSKAGQSVRPSWPLSPLVGSN